MVSVIIPSYNSQNTIRRCLSSLKNQTYTDKFEIILVDSSTDQTAEIVQQYFPNVLFHHFEQKTDPGTARNTGIQMSTGEILLFIDSDCVAASDWIERHVDSHKENPEVYAVGGAALNGNNPKNQAAWAGYMLEFREFLPTQPKGNVQHIPTLNISYKRRTFEEFGSFDPLYYPQEDLVFNYNLTAKGKKILFDPDIRVWHNHRTEISGFLKHQRSIGRITAQVLKIVPLPGAQIARSRILITILGPVLPIVKFFRTFFVFLSKSPKILIYNPGAVFLMMIGLLFWLAGFLIGGYSGKMGE